jgi:O-antigen ligase
MPSSAEARSAQAFSRTAVFLPVLAVTAAVSFTDGGFFPKTWGWTTIMLSALAAGALVVRERLELGRLDAAVLGLGLAVVGWVALSSAWSNAPSASLEEAERALIYAAALLAVFVLVPKHRVPELLAGVAAAATVVTAYGLSTRLFPVHRLTVDPIEGTLLIDPVGYANALGILAAIALLLAVAFAAHARATLWRGLAASTTVVLLPALYLTQSRGAWLALLAGFAVAVLLETQRAHFLSAALALAPAAAAVFWLAVRSPDLRDPEAMVGVLERAGHRLALAVVLLALASAALVLASARLQAALGRVRASLVVPGGIAAALVALALVGVLAIRGHLGDRPRYWHVAWSEFESHSLLGSGAGTFAHFWQRAYPRGVGVLDAHSLYLETLAELGVIGLVLLGVLLALPLAAAVCARKGRLVPGAAGAYVAYLVHTGLDWDWEMPAVTIAGLFCAAAIVLSARDGESSVAVSARLRGLLAALAGVLAALGFAVQVDHTGFAL